MTNVNQATFLKAQIATAEELNLWVGGGNHRRGNNFNGQGKGIGGRTMASSHPEKFPIKKQQILIKQTDTGSISTARSATQMVKKRKTSFLDKFCQVGTG